MISLKTSLSKGSSILDHIPHSHHLKFPKSSHTPFWEERLLYMATFGAFLV